MGPRRRQAQSLPLHPQANIRYGKAGITQSQTQAQRQMNQTAKSKEWARFFKASLSPTSRLGSLRGAERDGCLHATLKELGIGAVDELLSALWEGVE